MVYGVDGGLLRLISPFVRVRLESALAGFAVRASPAIDDVSLTTAHTMGVRPVRVLLLQKRGHEVRSVSNSTTP